MSTIDFAVSVPQVSIEEVARHVRAIRVGVSLVIRSVLKTLLGAEGDVEFSTGLKFDTNVGVGTRRCLNGAVEFDWA